MAAHCAVDPLNPSTFSLIYPYLISKNFIYCCSLFRFKTHTLTTISIDATAKDHELSAFRLILTLLTQLNSLADSTISSSCSYSLSSFFLFLFFLFLIFFLIFLLIFFISDYYIGTIIFFILS